MITMARHTQTKLPILLLGTRQIATTRWYKYAHENAQLLFDAKNIQCKFRHRTSAFSSCPPGERNISVYISNDGGGGSVWWQSSIWLRCNTRVCDQQDAIVEKNKQHTFDINIYEYIQTPRMHWILEERATLFASLDWKCKVMCALALMARHAMGIASSLERCQRSVWKVG